MCLVALYVNYCSHNPTAAKLIIGQIYASGPEMYFVKYIKCIHYTENVYMS